MSRDEEIKRLFEEPRVMSLLDAEMLTGPKQKQRDGVAMNFAAAEKVVLASDFPEAQGREVVETTEVVDTRPNMKNKLINGLPASKAIAQKALENCEV